MSKESKSKTLLVALVLAVCCSIFVSGAAVLLKPKQNVNRLNDRNKNVLIAAGLYDPEKSVTAVFESIQPVMVDLTSGTVTDGDVDGYFKNFKKLATDPAVSSALSPESDFAGIKRRVNQMPVYQYQKDGKLSVLVMPIYGQGLWSTLYGFLAVSNDANTVVGLTFYEHAETPGLGGEVDNPIWKQKWVGKKLFDEKGNPAIKVIKGVVDIKKSSAVYEIDGLSGATLTSRGVDNLVRFWIGENGFGPYLQNLRNGGTDG